MHHIECYINLLDVCRFVANILEANTMMIQEVHTRHIHETAASLWIKLQQWAKSGQIDVACHYTHTDITYVHGSTGWCLSDF